MIDVIVYFVLIHLRGILEMLCFLAIKHDCQSSQPPWNQIKMRDSDLSIGEKDGMNRKK